MRILIGLGVLVTLALLASSRQLWSMRRHPVGAMLSTGGWLAVAFGMLLGPHVSGLIGEGQMAAMRPLVIFCLGWVGLMIGFQAHRSLPSLLPRPIVKVMIIDAALSVAVLTLASILVLRGQTQQSATWIIGLLLGMCGIGWSAEVRSLRQGIGRETRLSIMIRSVSGLGSLVAVLGYGLIFKLGQSDGSTQSSGDLIASLGLSLIIAIAMGMLVMWFLREAGREDSQFLVVLLGVVSIVSGSAAALGYSPLFVAMVCGAVVVNLPESALDAFKRVILEAEQPMAMALMLFAGVMAEPAIGTRGVILVAILLFGRLLVKAAVSAVFLKPLVEEEGERALAWGALRQGPLAVALALGYAVSATDQMPAAGLNPGQLLMIVVLVGVVSDAFALAQRKLSREDSSRATEGV